MPRPLGGGRAEDQLQMVVQPAQGPASSCLLRAVPSARYWARFSPNLVSVEWAGNNIEEGRWLAFCKVLCLSK